ncbi:carboxypeptidase N subunit 2-like [Chironomus tepperi]|uniref:carboxypeptidase N subunit 2-like n=1 Tax=Chironomus tepperi TaxID=113505 RepID=UPI00391F4BCA
MLELYNPTGLYNFSEIEGTHLSEKTDDDVKIITRDRVVTMPVYPSVILNKFKNAEKLELTNSIFETIEVNAFESCKNLLYLDFSNNKFKRLENDLLRNCRNLTLLSFYSNEVSKIDENAFINLSSVQTLILSYNPIEHLSKNIFKPLISLIRLDANYMKLKIIHSYSFGGHRFFTTFNLIGNQINAFDEKIIDNTAIDFIDVRSNACVNGQLKDTSIMRASLRAALRICIQNYNTVSIKNATLLITETIARNSNVKQEFNSKIKGNVRKITGSDQ